MPTFDERALQELARQVTNGRLDRGMGQLPFARTAGIDVKTLTGIEAGKRAPHPGTQRKIERALGWEPGTIRQILEGQRGGSPVPRAAHLTDEELLAEVAWRFRRYKESSGSPVSSLPSV
jgi:transcriptional regulator with XRE-family HTH domain